MDTRAKAHKASLDTAAPSNISIRAAEPADAAAMSALMGSPGVFEGTLQMPYAAVASRVERFSKIDSNSVVPACAVCMRAVWALRWRKTSKAKVSVTA
jgi:hypothetical protein